MVKKIMGALLLAAFVLNAHVAVSNEAISRVAPKVTDHGNGLLSKANFTGSQGTTFDKSPNGYGWYGGFNRKIQTNIDPELGSTMVGSVYRRLADTGSGTIGGMIGQWPDGSSFTGYAQTIYGSSGYQNGTTGLPGGRFPFASAFINGYFFGLFNDYDLTVEGGEVSQPMFAVSDATWGWDESEWSAPKRMEAVESGAAVPGAWLGKGDVAYNPDDGYYYWATTWDMGGLVEWNSQKFPFVTGRSQTPEDPESWEWTDYNDIIMDCSDRENGFLNTYGAIQLAFAKDIYGNGTGFGIAVAPFIDVTYEVFNNAGEPIDVTNTPRLGYIYTTNWGADWSSGDFKSNWVTPGMEGNNMLPADINKLFDWYNMEIEIEEGVFIPLNLPYMVWNADVIVTETNEAHVLVKVVPMSTESDLYWFPLADGRALAGYYDIVGDITDDGVKWRSANYIATYMGLDNGDTEWKYSNTHKLSIGHAGHGVIYASWWDRPESRYMAPPETLADPDTEWIDDAFFSYSPDNGRTWIVDKSVFIDSGEPDVPPYELKYAFNVTKTGNIHEEGWVLASHGTNFAQHTDNGGIMTVFAACQYYDPENVVIDPPDGYKDFQQFMTVWKITGTGTGIEMEQASLTKDFALYQNYPNPFNPVTEIKFALQNDTDVKLTVFNIKGETVTELKNERLSKGVHAVNFDASSLNSGVYFYRLNAGGRSETKKMMLIK